MNSLARMFSFTMINCDFPADSTNLKVADFKQRIGRKKFFKPDNIKNNILSHCPAHPVRCDMRTSGKKENNSIENINFQNIPEKVNVQPGHNEYFHYPFRINKQGKRAEIQSV